jgi:hypothetical protein
VEEGPSVGPALPIDVGELAQAGLDEIAVAGFVDPFEGTTEVRGAGVSPAGEEESEQGGIVGAFGECEVERFARSGPVLIGGVDVRSGGEKGLDERGALHADSEVEERGAFGIAEPGGSVERGTSLKIVADVASVAVVEGGGEGRCEEGGVGLDPVLEEQGDGVVFLTEPRAVEEGAAVLVSGAGIGSVFDEEADHVGLSVLDGAGKRGAAVRVLGVGVGVVPKEEAGQVEPAVGHGDVERRVRLPGPCVRVGGAFEEETGDLETPVPHGRLKRGAAGAGVVDEVGAEVQEEFEPIIVAGAGGLERGADVVEGPEVDSNGAATGGKESEESEGDAEEPPLDGAAGGLDVGGTHGTPRLALEASDGPRRVRQADQRRPRKALRSCSRIIGTPNLFAASRRSPGCAPMIR